MRKICVVSGSRADYGILSGLIKKISQDDKIQNYFVVTGSHLMDNYGFTLTEIRKDKVKIDKKIKLKNYSDSQVSIVNSISFLIAEFGKYFYSIKPDLLIVLGDRYEIYSSVIAATIYNIPIAHFHGGELTEGSIDESFRHSISKFSHIHFVSHKSYKNNLIQLGENKRNIFNIGSLSLQNISKLKIINKAELEKRIKFKLKKKNILITYHPVTNEPNSSFDHFNNIILSLEKIRDIGIIFTYPNIDYENSVIIKSIDNFVLNNSKIAISVKSLGYENYISLLKFVDIVVGNSSSGIIEAPFLGTYTLNIGNRQNGRVFSDSIINCKDNHKSIYINLKKLIEKSNKPYIKKSIFYKPNSVNKVCKIIKSIKLDNILKKKFYKIKY